MVHLHVHSCYSLLDSISKLEDIVQKVKELNQNAVAITDHGVVYSSVKMYKLCKQYNIKFIYGCEFYICDDIKVRDKDNKYYHLVVLAKDETGRQNLNILLSKAHLEGKYYKPRIDFNLLKQYHEGLVVLSACMAGEISRYLLNNDKDKARNTILKYKSLFKDDYYLEIQSHTDPIQQQLNKQIIELGKELQVSWVVTTDSHYINKEDQKTHSIFVQIGEERETGETYNDCYIQNETEIRDILATCLSPKDIDIAISNTDVIAQKCNVDIPLSPPIIPHVNVPPQYPSEMEYLKDLCRKGWIYRGINKLDKNEQQKYLDRLLYEFNAIDKMGFAGYYLLVYGYANSVTRRGIARGSGGGSLVAYLMNITDIDPVQYGLYFERFIDVSALNLLEQGQIKPEELKIPDFDLDFGQYDRDKVLQYIVNQYGQDKVVSIGTFIYMQDKLAIKDIGRVLGIPFNTVNTITSLIDDYGIDDVIKQYSSQYPQLFEYAQALSGLPRAFSKHPSGKIIANRNLDYYTALAENDGELVLQCDMHDAEDLGLVKVDLLGLRTIDVIYDTLDMIGKDYNYIAPKCLNFNDADIWCLFQNGDTGGIFQFESVGMQQVLKKMQPTCLDDLAVANALYRPGAKKYIDNYIARKQGVEQYTYIHPDLEPILKSTFGIIVFQEQLIEIGRLANLRNPDDVRKACAKKKADLMAKIEPELKQGLIQKGWTEQQADVLWNDIVDFARYSFNRSHSYAYAIIAYITAMLKVHHTKEFYCALLNSYIGKYDELAIHCADAIKHGIRFAPNSYKNSYPLCTIKQNQVYYGIGLIKHCNQQIATELQEIASRQHTDFVDLLLDITNNTTINAKQLEILITLNYFAEFGKNQKLLNIFKEFTKKYKKTHTDKTKQKRITELKQYAQTLPDKSLPVSQQLAAEKEYLGYIQTIFPAIDNLYVIVTDINTRYTPKITATILNNGETKVYKMWESILFNQPTHDNPEVKPLLDVYDIIRINNILKKPVVYKKDDQWIQTNEMNEYITSYTIVQKYQSGKEK